MDIKDFINLSKHSNERYSTFAELRRHEDLSRATLLGSLGSLAYPYSTHTGQLMHQVADIARESAVFAAQSQMQFGLHDQIKQLTQGWATTHTLTVMEDLRTKMASGLLGFPHLYVRVESERAALMASVRAATENTYISTLASLSAAINETSLLATTSWIRGLERENSWRIHEKTVGELFKPNFAYDRFAARTLDQLREPISHSRAAGLTASLLLANEQTIRATSLFQPIVDLTSIDEGVQPRTLGRGPIFNRYRIQRQELLDRGDDIREEDDYETLLPLAPSTGSFEIARHCLELVGMCLETSQTCTGESIFKLTPMVLISFSGLLGTIAWNRMTLTQVVENLYIILYESAGKDKLRYIEGGYVNDDECEVIWKIKHLRNKWLSHDAEHGKDRDIVKARQARKEALQWLGADGMPTSKEDYGFIHESLLSRVDDFLSLLLTRIAGKARSTSSS